MNPTEEALVIDDQLSVPLNEIEFSAVRAGGPGGQHVNRTASAVQLRFDVGASTLPEDLKQRLLGLSDQRLSVDGVLVIRAQEHRSQHQNRAAALGRLADLIRSHRHPPRHRKATRPSRAAKRKRLEGKRQRGELKRLRRPPRD